MDERTSVEKSDRLAAATRHLADAALDGLIAVSNGLNNFLDSNAAYVFSGVRPIGVASEIHSMAPAAMAPSTACPCGLKLSSGGDSRASA